ncbi:microcystin-dependent protein [Sphingomonas kyeonggiensis]|uniref:Microcystin-dependent protein n=1 Tax=Sphingomonas kyeonggiensis TaxID=1268553 RepID=A0A7W7K197_9SPHN|nr:tail fiber protein [Sphingomonas kyeonggiensis]MBB4838560.1 microcystin-dependent protein [Sphingomonas kyeonggiensis]
MAQPYVGELRIFAGNFAPAGWMFCEGQLLPISENETLFNLIGTTYGGDGQSTFALPDLRGRLAIHQGTGSSGTSYLLAETGGAEEVTLSINQIPAHSHPMLGASGNGTQANPKNNVLASSTLVKLYSGEAADTAMSASSITSIGSSQPHTNFQPYLCLNYIISLFGIFPSQN